MKSNNILEINGRLYDAKTGLPLSERAKQVIKSAIPAAARSIDGFSPRKSSAQTSPIKKVASSVKQNIAVTEDTHKKSTAPMRAVSSSIRVKNSRSLTLNRKAVKQPKLSLPEKISSAPKQTKTVSSPAIKHAPQNERLERAQQINRSSAITRFSARAHKKSTTPSSGVTPATAHNKAPQRPSQATAPLSTKERLISQAVTKAALNDVHKAKVNRGHKLHLGRYVTSGLVVALLAGYVAYLNVPSISMKVAAHRAGFAAALPGYQPSGYSFSGPIAYSPGQVTVNFSSNTDNRKFSLKQQPTTWDSAALLENLVTRQNSSYLTYQDRGLTIYIYDGSSAAWVNGGKMYQLEGRNSQLDTDQLLKLATSV